MPLDNTGAPAPRPLSQWVEHLKRQRIAGKKARAVERRRKAVTKARLVEAERLLAAIIESADVIGQGVEPDGYWHYPATYNDPHIKPGEFAIVDMNDTTFVSGEVYLIGWKSGHKAESICQVIERTMRGIGGKPFQDIWFCPLNRPYRFEDIDWSKPVYASDGPLKPQYLPEYIKGRVIGIFMAKDDPRVPLPAAPKPRRECGGPT